MGSQVMAQLCLALKEKQYFESHGCLLLLLFLRMVGGETTMHADTNAYAHIDKHSQPNTGV